MTELFDLIESLPLSLRMAALLGLALLVATLIVVILYPVLGATAKRINSISLEKFSQRTRSSVFWILSAGLTLIFWAGLVPESGTPEAASFPIFVHGLQILVRTFLYIYVAVLIIKVVNVGTDTLRHYYAADDVNSVRERKILTQLQYIQRVIGVVVFIVFGALILMQFSAMQRLGTTLLTTAGVSGIIIGFAAQKSIANLLAGFQIAFTQPIRIDDALVVNGEYGWVEEITLTYVTMRLWDQRRQIVPLQKFIDDTFQNWTRTNSELIGAVLLYVDYTFPVPALREEIARYLPTQELWDERVQSVLVTDNNDKAMTVRVLVSARNAGDTFTLRCATREHCINWIQENHRDSLPQNRVAPPLGQQPATKDTDQIVAAEENEG